MHNLRAMYRIFLTWLSQIFFPAIVAYATHPIVIFLTIVLIIPLIVFANVTSVALVLGNYTNVTSAAVASIILYQQLSHHQEVKHLHKTHADELQKLHAKIDQLASGVPTARRRKRST